MDDSITADKDFYGYLVDGLADMGIYWLSPDGVIQSWSHGAERLTGYRADEVIGEHFSVFYSEEDRKRDFPTLELDEARRSGKYEGTGWRIRKDGSRVWMEVIVASLRGPDGSPKGFAKIVRDATQRKLDEELIVRQKRDILELSTPVLQLWEGVLALPIVGNLDTARSQMVMERLLTAIARSGSTIVILDISGVATVDTVVAQHLIKTIDAARLMGAQCIISGIRPEIAQTIVHLGIDLSAVRTRGSVARALEEALAIKGLRLAPTEAS